MLPEYWSYSRHNLVFKCGEQYRRRYIEGERTPPGIAMFRGRAAHAAIEANLVEKMDNDGAMLPLEELLQIAADKLNAELSGEWEVGGQYEGKTPKEAKAIVARETHDVTMLHAEVVAPTIDPIAVEARFEIPKDVLFPIPLVAIIDVVSADGVVHDTKTKGAKPRQGEAAKSEQLTTYDIAYTAWRKERPKRLQLDSLVRTKSGLVDYYPQATTRTAADLDVFVRRANRAIEMVDQEIYLPAKDGEWWCSQKWCGYASTCPFFRGRRRPTT